MIPIPPIGWNPFSQLGSTAAQIVTDAWTAAWLAVWSAGLWVLRLVLGFMEQWMTPDLSENGPGHDLYQTMLWLAGVLMVVLLAVQLGVAAFRRDGKHLAGALIGVGQFGLVCVAWISYAVALVVGMGGLTRAMMESLLNVTSWNDFKPWDSIDVKSITDAGVATALGLLGLLVWLAAIAHFIVLLARNAALLVLVATGPIAAAGLANKTTAAWFWKALRWLHAAAATPLMVVIVMGVGMKFTEGVAAGKAGSMEATVGTALPAAVLICVSVVAPLALFKLLAFVDPGTASGAAMRAGWQASGGLQGLLSGNPAATTADDGSSSSSAAAGDAGDGSAGDAGAEAATNSRVNGVVQSAASFLGPVGAAFSAGIGMVTSIGSTGASLISDVTNQAGIGNNSYQPDFQGGDNNQAARANREANGTDNDNAAGGGDDAGPPPGAGPSSSGPGGGGSSAGGSSGGGGGSSGGGGGGSAGGGGAAGGVSAGEAAEVAVVAL